jgi:hypothetical protein
MRWKAQALGVVEAVITLQWSWVHVCLFISEYIRYIVKNKLTYIIFLQIQSFPDRNFDIHM